MLGRHGDVRLGPDENELEYSYLSWFAMLFSAGMPRQRLAERPGSLAFDEPSNHRARFP
ncbi:BCCT family transporter [Noviherbaspirillum soli]|uniref:BCCT family transporter n=1 Tax=Noviherbaspirillum soli TaxID=1064518 RepID=UPI0022654658|nr:BCCT family transporter [Noviherbaspirillum soli]